MLSSVSRKNWNWYILETQSAGIRQMR